MMVGTKLKEIRKRKGITLKDLSSACGLSTAYISNLERFGIVAQGTLIMDIAGSTYTLYEGDSIYIPAYTPHKYKNIGEIDCITYWSICRNDKERADEL